MQNFRRRCALTATLIAGLLCSGQASAIGGTGAEWGARDPGTCASVQLDAAPSPEQVVAMLRCKHEVAASTGELWLMENVQVDVGAAVPFVEAYGDYVMDDGDVDSMAYNIRGSFTWSVCITKADAAIYGKGEMNCYETDVPAAKGVCWKTSFADYRCRFVGSIINKREPTSPPQ